MPQTPAPLIPVILCGGAGSRLWPVSRDTHPKPFITLADGQSLLQKAFVRGAALPGVSQVLTVTNRELTFKTQDAFAPVNPKGLATSFILEPFGRNTAPAIAAAALVYAGIIPFSLRSYARLKREAEALLEPTPAQAPVLVSDRGEAGKA